MNSYELEQALACKQMEVEDLRQQLAAALAACKVKDEALVVLERFASTVGPSSSFWDEFWPKYEQALAIHPDDSVLKEWLGEPVCFYDGNKFYADEKSAFVSMANTANLRPLYAPKGMK